MKLIALMPQDSPEWNLLNELTHQRDDALVHCRDRPELDLILKTSSGKKTLFCRYEDRHLVNFTGMVDPNLSVVLFLDESLKKKAREILDVVSTRNFIAQQSANLDRRELEAVIEQLKNSHRGGLTPYLMQSTSIGIAEVFDPASKLNAIDSIESSILKMGGDAQSARFQEYGRRISELVDELILNAIFDANPRMKDVERGRDFKLDATERIDVQWGFDGETFGVMVRDPFGLLSKETILRYIDEANTALLPVLERKSGGLGFKIILERLHQMVVRVYPNRLTEIMCLMRFEKRFRDFDARLKSFHYFTL